MRVVFFNIWHGTVWTELEPFIRKEAPRTDVFGFLETDPKIREKLNNLLVDFNSITSEGILNNEGVEESRSLYVKSGVGIVDFVHINPFVNKADDTGGFTKFRLNNESKEFYLVLIHGKTCPGDKLDTPVRIDQSSKIIDSVSDSDRPVIIGGDFNLLPDTKSIEMFELAGYRNLIKEFNVKETRNHYCWDQFRDGSDFVEQHFADYCFVNKYI
jgi:hypothetical protein